MYRPIVKWSHFMKKFMKVLMPILLAALIVFSIGWYLLSYDRDFTRDTLLDQARYHDLYGNSRMSSWFYRIAYQFSGQDGNVAIELANRYKSDGNFTKAEYTLSNAIFEEPSVELYIALCRTYVEQDKLLDAVNLLSNISNPQLRAELDALRPAAPSADYAPGFYSQYISITLTSPDGVLFCTTDGEYPSTTKDTYTGPIVLQSGETTIYAITVAENGLVSPMEILGYTVGGVIEPAVFSDPAMELAVREYLDFPADDTLFTNDLWGIREFTIPDTVTSYEDLALIPYLTSLTISGHTMDNLDHLAGMTKLEKLDLSGSRFPAESLAILETLPSLTDLTLTDCGLSTIAALENVMALARLDLSENTIRNLEPISKTISLRELYLGHNAVVSLEALSGLSLLEKLDVSYNSLTSLAPLNTCLKLNWLEASNNAITSVEGLETLNLLQYLSVEFNQLTDLSPLTGCTEITELSVATNQLKNIDAVSNMAKLDVLDFSSNEVEALPQWADGCTLRIIDGSYNKLESIDSLNQLQHLTHVYMEYNQLKSIDALADCYRLVHVDVFGNKVKDVSRLTERDIIVNYDPT